jgi:hypothetical protein
LKVSTDIHFALGIGWSWQVLGRMARVQGEMVEAARSFTEALSIFRAIGAQFELARTHLELATVAKTTGDAEALRSSLLQAHRIFLELPAPKYLERVRRLGEGTGLSLAN